MDYEKLDAALERVRTSWPDAAPTHALICGSGWSQVVETFERVDAIPYEEIPGLGRPTVKGHSGMLTHATLAGKSTLIFQGRRHFYEGEGWTPIALPIYLAIKLGVKTMVLTNSAGGVRAGMQPGDLMAISDHVNFMHANPLIGDHNDVWGPRFPDQSTVYDPELRSTLIRAAGISEHALTHAEVTETTKLTMPRMTKLIAAFWEAM